MKPSAEALERAKKAGELDQKLSDKFGFNGGPYPGPPTTKELAALDQQLDDLLAELKKLPRFTPKEMKEAYEAFSDETIIP